MDQLKKAQFLEILKKYQAGNASKEEVEFLDAYYEAFGLRDGFTDYLKEGDQLSLRSDLMESIKKDISVEQARATKTNKKPIVRRTISAAAAIIIVVGVGFLFYASMNSPKQAANLTAMKDIAPGGNKAVLTLSNGEKISLTDAKNGELVENSGIRVTKAADGQLLYTALGGTGESHLKHHTIETPKGGQYQIILPDGSKVWLNAASSLTYPVSFASLDKRIVELNGEAYFEVAKDSASPFVVITDNQEVEVLGTHFNICSYRDNPFDITTLLEGSIKVLNRMSDNSELLQPGQQSIIEGSITTVTRADADEAIAWKNGNFRFDDEALEEIMRIVSRWYDVDVVWHDASVKNEHFAAVTTRFANVSRLLKMLEKTGDVKFEIEGRKIEVKKKNRLIL